MSCWAPWSRELFAWHGSRIRGRQLFSDCVMQRRWREIPVSGTGETLRGARVLGRRQVSSAAAGRCTKRRHVPCSSICIVSWGKGQPWRWFYRMRFGSYLRFASAVDRRRNGRGRHAMPVKGTVFACFHGWTSGIVGLKVRFRV